MRINIFGDFVAHDISRISIAIPLKKVIADGDFNIVNFEAPVKTTNQIPSPKSGPSLCQDPNAPQWLESNGFNVFCLANNHIFDYGAEGFLATKNLLQNVYTVGAGKYEQAFSPVYVEKKGIKVAIFSLAELQFGVFYDERIDSDRLAAGWINLPLVENYIKDAKAKCDYVILIAHAGLEGEEIPLPEWRNRYRQLIDAGCDVIVGGHTHCAQGFEQYHGKMIFYSVGNFCFSKQIDSNSYWNLGELVSLYITKEGINCRCLGTSFSNGILNLLESTIWDDKLLKLNNKLSSPEYEGLVDEICRRHLVDYLMLCKWSGFIHYKTLSFKILIKQLLLKYFHCTQEFSHLHMLNNLQCETHRWCFMRGLKLLK